MKVIKVAQVVKESHPGPMFTGHITMQPIVDTELSKEFRIAQVNFGRGVRNKFHSHTFEQVLVVTEGKGIVATEKEQIAVVPGDVIFIPSGEKVKTKLDVYAVAMQYANLFKLNLYNQVNLALNDTNKARLNAYIEFLPLLVFTPINSYPLYK